MTLSGTFFDAKLNYHMKRMNVMSIYRKKWGNLDRNICEYLMREMFKYRNGCNNFTTVKKEEKVTLPGRN